MKRIGICLTLTAVLTGMLIAGSERAYAQERGTITGTITDAVTGEALPGASVEVLNTSLGAYADVNGQYTVRNVPVGTYGITISSIGYVPITINSVTVTAGGSARHSVQLAPEEDGKSTAEAVVRGKRSTRSEAGALAERQNAVQVVDNISAEEISKAGASDAGDAMKRVTGVSVVGDKYVVVRGLGERYNATQLNGVNLVSPEPEKKVVPFDLFPTGMIDKLTTVKTFTPDNPGDFAGGLVKIETKDFPEDFILNASVGTGINTETQGADAIFYEGGGLDWLGIDDGSRELPEGIDPQRRFNAEEQASLLRAFGETTWRPEERSLPVNQSLSLTLGNSFGDESPIGVLFSASYANSFKYRTGIERAPLLATNSDGRHALRYDYLTREAEQSVLWGTLLNLSLGLGESSMIGVKAMLNHSAEDEATLVTGAFNASTTGEVRRTQLRFVERTIAGVQLMGEHASDFLSEGGEIEWRLAYSSALRSEPDNRATSYLRSGPEDEYRYNGNFGSGNGRFFSDLADHEVSTGIDWTIPIYTGDELETATKLKAGALGRLRDRSFDARRFYFAPGAGSEEQIALDPEELFTPEIVSQGALRFDDNTLPTDAYDASEFVTAGYAMIELPVMDRLRFVGGARVEWWKLELTPFDQINDYAIKALTVNKSVLDILPSANLIYGLAEDMNLRGSFSQTLARPEFRELAPFRFDDYLQSTFGNPALERTRIMNYDLRWEWFARPGEIFAISGFYKNFTNPIEQFYLLGGSDIQVEPVNASGANTFGAEFEIRKGLDQLASALENFEIGANLTLVQSTISFDENDPVRLFTGTSTTNAPVASLTNLERPLQGQSPYVLNMMLGYGNDDWGTDATVVFNVSGERLAAVGTSGYPDIYEQPRPTLDLTLFQELPSGLKLSLKGTNLLDAETRFTQEFEGTDAELIETQRYLSGRSFSIGLSFSMDQFRLQRETN